MNERGAQTVAEVKPVRTRWRLPVRLTVTGASIAVWFWTQSLLGARNLPELQIGDGLHILTAPLNRYLHVHPSGANALLIVSSAIIDILGIFLLLKWIVKGSVRPFLGLVMVLGLRQIMQALVALPAPPDAIWHYPGFPSIFVTYGVANDYFFSGHTAIAVLAAIEVARAGQRWLTGIAVLIVLFEILTVLALRAHYTMDVFTGIVTAVVCAQAASRITESE